MVDALTIKNEGTIIECKKKGSEIYFLITGQFNSIDVVRIVVQNLPDFLESTVVHIWIRKTQIPK